MSKSKPQTPAPKTPKAKKAEAPEPKQTRVHVAALTVYGLRKPTPIDDVVAAADKEGKGDESNCRRLIGLIPNGMKLTMP
jgi:hypothetical protein